MISSKLKPVHRQKKILADTLIGHIIGHWALCNQQQHMRCYIPEYSSAIAYLPRPSAISLTDRVLPRETGLEKQPSGLRFPCRISTYTVMDVKNRPVIRALYNILAHTTKVA